MPRCLLGFHRAPSLRASRLCGDLWCTKLTSTTALHFRPHAIACNTADGISIPNWNWIGNTVVTDEYIRLTPDRQTKRGAVWNVLP